MRNLLALALTILTVACGSVGLTPPAPLDGATGQDPDGLMAKYGSRWEEATGVNPASLGFRVYYATAEGMQECGAGVTEDTMGCAFLEHGVAILHKGMLPVVEEAVVLHELGHLMAGIADHTETGLMSSHFRYASWGEFREGTKIDYATLELVCGGVHCDHHIAE